MNLRFVLSIVLPSVLAGCTGTLTVGRSADGGTGSSSAATSVGASAGSTSSGTTSGGTTGGTTSGGVGCGQGLTCFGERCLIADCSGAARGSACGLADGGAGACRDGACEPPPGNDPQNCGFPGASCPDGLTCTEGVCFTSEQTNAETCDGLTCPAGRVCELIGYLGAYCVRSSCGQGDDDRICGDGLDGGRALRNNQSDPSFCCASACVDTGSDPDNCGGCGIVCAADATCQPPASAPTAGACLPTSCAGRSDGSACLSGSAQGICCGGRCTNLGGDPDNCGVCGMSCRGAGDAGFQCTQGRCAIVAADGAPVACLQGQVCPAGWTCSIDGVCVTDCSSAPDGVYCGESATERFVGGSPSRVCCNHRCVDSSLDPANCGACDQACDAGDSCFIGVCERTDCSLASGGFTPCPLPDGGGGMCCGERCVDRLSDDLDCGLCGEACGGSSTCRYGICGDAGAAPCGGSCPASTRCSVVDNLCHPLACGPTDTNNLCAFADGGLEPDLGICCDGTCVDPLFDPNNCLGCGIACGVGDSCFEIGCGGERPTCGVDGGYRCPAGDVCLEEASCVPLSCEGRDNGEACLFGFTSSGPDVGICCGGRCVDTTQDPVNCGGCGMVAHGELCADYQSDTGCIDSACADLSSDPRHCGDCLTACPAGQTCSGGTCSGSPACGPGRRDGLCDPDAGTGRTGLPLLCCAGAGCVDFSSDGQNCGFCGNVCASGSSCQAGKCR